MPTPLDYADRSCVPNSETPWWLGPLMGAVLILALLAFAVPKWTSRPTVAARVASARIEMEQLQLQLDDFKRDVGRFPTAAEGLGALYTEPPGAVGWRGPYLKRPPIDPWAVPYVYTPPAGTFPSRIVSAGPDRRLGTSDDIASQ